MNITNPYLPTEEELSCLYGYVNQLKQNVVDSEHDKVNQLLMLLDDYKEHKRSDEEILYLRKVFAYTE